MIYQCQWRSQGHIFGELDKIASDQIFPEISLILGADFIADLGFSHTPTFFTIGGAAPLAPLATLLHPLEKYSVLDQCCSNPTDLDDKGHETPKRDISPRQELLVRTFSDKLRFKNLNRSHCIQSFKCQIHKMSQKR